ncbi:hypothetical protein CEXT_403261 [Caerostris extrusa]|uniref:Peptidase A1 domain-containing protein n=1 Tax=Caerostris extrusa TaxID=172846 RepID=A0AAV4XI25_CAEEX|nr:hypothetical protein CEXT_403261 [Caerostris extrusa]
MVSIQNIGFRGYVPANFVQTDSSQPHSYRDSFSTIRDPSATFLTFNVTDQTYAWDKCLGPASFIAAGGYIFKDTFQRKFTSQEMRAEVRKRCALKDQGL